MRLISALLLPIATAACSLSGRTVAVGPQPPGADTGLFAAVVRFAVASQARFAVPVEVDPRPLWGDPIVQDVYPSTLADVPESVSRARAAMLLRLGVQQGDGLAWLRYPNCRNTPDPAGRTGCPTHEQIVFTLGLPREGSAYYVGGFQTIDQREADRGKGYWSVRVVMIAIGPDGFNRETHDAVMAPGPDGWREVKYVLLDCCM